MSESILSASHSFTPRVHHIAARYAPRSRAFFNTLENPALPSWWLQGRGKPWAPSSDTTLHQHMLAGAQATAPGCSPHRALGPWGLHESVHAEACVGRVCFTSAWV